MFSNAKTIAAAPKSSAKKRETVELDGIKKIAILSALITNAQTMLETLESEMKETGFQRFMEMKGSTRPTSFVGVEEEATCSIEMRKRSSNSRLTDEEVELIEMHDIKVPETVVTQELFAINPKYAEDAALLSKVERALSGKVPEDFIVKQEGVTKRVVTDEMLDEAFKKAKTEDLIRVMTTMALKPKLNAEYDMTNLISDALEIMQPKPKAKVTALKKKA